MKILEIKYVIVYEGRLKEMTEEEIAVSLKKEPDKAIAYIKKEYGMLIRFVIGNILEAPEEIDECEEDTYVSIWENADAIDVKTIKAYIMRIARNKALERYRYLNAGKRSRKLTVYLEELDEELAAENIFEKKAESEELYNCINDFLSGLKAISRKLFILRYWYDASTEDISKMTGFSKSKIESDIIRTKKKLKNYLKERCNYE